MYMLVLGDFRPCRQIFVQGLKKTIRTNLLEVFFSHLRAYELMLATDITSQFSLFCRLPCIRVLCSFPSAPWNLTMTLLRYLILSGFALATDPHSQVSHEKKADKRSS